MQRDLQYSRENSGHVQHFRFARRTSLESEHLPMQIFQVMAEACEGTRFQCSIIPTSPLNKQFPSTSRFSGENAPGKKGGSAYGVLDNVLLFYKKKVCI